MSGGEETRREVGPAHGAPGPRGVLFVCVQNSARSQMAEAWARRLFPPGVRIWSAGSDPAAEVDPRVVRVMREVGVDCSKQKPKSISEVPLAEVDTVITVCDERACPALPGQARRQSWEIPDPGKALGDDEPALELFRSVRDELRNRIDNLMKSWG